MSKPLIPDHLRWAIETLLPPELPKVRGSRTRCEDWAAPDRIIFVLRSGITWEMPPREPGCSGMTC